MPGACCQRRAEWIGSIELHIVLLPKRCWNWCAAGVASDAPDHLR